MTKTIPKLWTTIFFEGPAYGMLNVVGLYVPLYVL